VRTVLPDILAPVLDELLSLAEHLREAVGCDQPDGWIPVQERLPEDGHMVMVYGPAIGVTAAVRHNGSWWIQEWTEDRITHWRELPKGPK
jgi:hypothetical protein